MKIKVLGVMVAVGLMVVSAANAGDWEKINPGPKPSEENAREQAQAFLSKDLFDPDSAQFRNWTPFFKRTTRYSLVRAKPKGAPLWGLCVELNAKNRMGGFVGYKTYIVNFKDGAIFSAMEELFGECRAGVEDSSRH